MSLSIKSESSITANMFRSPFGSVTWRLLATALSGKVRARRAAAISHVKTIDANSLCTSGLSFGLVSM
jgi:hypothetical protein